MTIKIYSGRIRAKAGKDGINASGPIRRIELFLILQIEIHLQIVQIEIIQIIIHSGIIQICGIIQIGTIIQFLEIIQIWVIGIIGVIGVIIIEIVKEMILIEEDNNSLEIIVIIFHNSKGS